MRRVIPLLLHCVVYLSVFSADYAAEMTFLSFLLHVANFYLQDTFQTLKNWVKELRQHGPPNIVVAIAGNKCDLSDAR